MSVWIILQQRDGKLHRMSREAIVAGQRLAAALGEEAEAVLLGHELDELKAEAAGFELARIHVADHAALADYTPGGYVTALAGALRTAEPGFVVLPHTYQSIDFMARLAEELGAGLLPEVVSFSGDASDLRWKRPILSGKLEAEVRAASGGTTLVSVQSGAFPGDEAATGSAEVLALDLPADLAADREVLGVEEVAGEHVDLSSAEIIVAVGRGVGGDDKMAPILELAQALGAEIGASRPVIDSGWLERDRQIGSSGQTVAPKLYLGLGISGAIQHLVGMKGSSCVVAVNKDSGAPLFNVAQYGIVGDLHELVPALTEAVKELKARD